MSVPSPDTANEVIESQLDDLLAILEKVVGADVLAFIDVLVYGADDEIRNAIELRESRRDRLVMVLETAGGYVEVAERIVETLRRHYKRVEFIVPNFAMSAGSVLAMSGDAIHMDYYSVLGPIDPQVERPSL